MYLSLTRGCVVGRTCDTVMCVSFQLCASLCPGDCRRRRWRAPQARDRGAAAERHLLPHQTWIPQIHTQHPACHPQAIQILPGLREDPGAGLKEGVQGQS